MHHNAGNHHRDTHACLSDGVKLYVMSCCGLLPHKALVLIAKRQGLSIMGYSICDSHGITLVEKTSTFLVFLNHASTLKGYSICHICR